MTTSSISATPSPATTEATAPHKHHGAKRPTETPPPAPPAPAASATKSLVSKVA